MCSYFPLTLIICVLQYQIWPWWVLALLGGVFGLGSVGVTLLYLGYMRHTLPYQQETVSNFSPHDADVMSYIASYLVPFVTFPLGGGKQIATLLIFIAVLMIIYVRSNMIYINPVLNIFGYHLYEIEVGPHSQRSHYYIARKPLERGHEIRFVVLSDDIYLEK
jgi:hypothetical protein